MVPMTGDGDPNSAPLAGTAGAQGKPVKQSSQSEAQAQPRANQGNSTKQAKNS